MKKLKGKWKKITVGVLLTVAVLVLGLLLFIKQKTYPAMDEALALLEEVRVREEADWLVVEPEGEVLANVILYQGGLVETEAYLPLAYYLSEGDVRVILPKMPVNLAILGIDEADDIIAHYGMAEPWWLGGHSLGGTSGAMYAVENSEKLAGLFFLASYPSESTNLSDVEFPVLSLTGSQDEIVDSAKFEGSRELLPEHTTYLELEGGNHSQFGHYGFQDGDGESSLTREEQIEFVGDVLLEMIRDEVRD